MVFYLDLWRVQQATDEAEAKPPKPPDTSKWRCTLCLKTMLSKDSTAHKKGKRHTAAVAKAGNSQSVPETTTIEVEAKPLKSPNESRWTCTLCLTTMSSNDATAHKKGQRHMAAVVKAGNSQSAPTITTTEVEAEPPSPPKESRWTCTLCLTTMSSSDATAHKKGKRHRAAVVKAVNLQSVPTARPSLQHNSPMPEPGARPTPPDIEETKSSTPVKSSAKAKKKKNKGNTTAKSKKSTKGTVPPSFSADGYDWQVQSYSGSSYDSSTCNTYFNSDDLDWSVCDKDCGWCGKCMDGAILYVLLSLYLLFFCFFKALQAIKELRKSEHNGRKANEIKQL